MDHANSSQHTASVMYFKTDIANTHNQPLTSFSPIACSLKNIGTSTKDRMKRTFDIPYSGKFSREKTFTK